MHYVDYGGPADAGAVVLVHGVGGSHLDWDLLAPMLATRFRVLAADLPGFGLSGPELIVAGKPAFLESIGMIWQSEGRIGVTPQGMPVLDALLGELVPDALAAA